MGVKINSKIVVKIDARVVRYIREESRMGIKIDSRMRFLESRMATKLVTVPISKYPMFSKLAQKPHNLTSSYLTMSI